MGEYMGSEGRRVQPSGEQQERQGGRGRDQQQWRHQVNGL